MEDVGHVLHAGGEMHAMKSSTGQGFAVVCLRIFDGVSHTMETRYKENFLDGVYLAHSEDHLIGSCPARVCGNQKKPLSRLVDVHVSHYRLHVVQP